MGRYLYGIISFFLLCSACVFGLFFYIAHNKCIDFSVLERYNPGRPSILLDDHGNEWARFQLDRRDPISLSEMPPHLIQAFLAAEDWSFFKHSGISWKGIIRSIVVNLSRGTRAQGASTITQQLVRLLFFDAKKTFSRKIKEQVVAIIIEQQFTKEQILQTYLNHVFFGCGIYGVQAACQRFWGKNALDITIDEAAVLAGIMRAPNKYCPILNPLSAEQRRNVVLRSMHTLGFITKEEYEHAKHVPVVITEQEKERCAPHLKEMIRIFMEDLVGKKELYSGGLIIQTTLSKDIQDTAQHAFTKQCQALRTDHIPDIDGALLSLDVKTGEIKALIGGFDFKTSKYNRATQARRQVGSTIKPLVYAAAIEAGMTFADTEIDEPLELPQAHGAVWKPNNVSKKFNGQMTLAWALSTSNNIVAIKTLLKVGIDPIVELARKCHVQGPFIRYPSLSLGCIDSTVKEVAGMFNVFANDGVYVEPHCIRWIKNQEGTKIWRYNPIKERVMSSAVVSQVSKVLEIGLKRLHERAPQPWIDGQLISKTGTTNDARTCWFTGSTPEITTTIYLGRDNNQPMGNNVLPIRSVFPIWIELHRQLPLTQKCFMYDPSLQEALIHERTGRIMYAPDPHVVSVLLPR